MSCLSAKIQAMITIVIILIAQCDIMNDVLVSILDNHGPCSSSTFAKLLVQKLNLSQSAARQRIKRNDNIQKLEGLNLRNNAQFLYLKKDFCSYRYWSALVDVLVESNSSYGFAIAALKQRKGVATMQQFITFCGSPVKQKKHIPAEAIVKNLEKIKLIEIQNIYGLGDCIFIQGNTDEAESLVGELKARLVAEDILLKAIASWAKNLGLVSYGTCKIRGENTEPMVGTFSWDLTAPSYLSPLTSGSKGIKTKPGFITCDVAIEQNITEHCIKAFLKKCQTLTYLPKIGKCLHIFVAENYSPKALRIAKENGIIPATIDTLFGKEITKSLKKLIDILSNTAEKFGNEHDIGAFFKSLGKIEGVAGNLRGTLFEFLIAEVIRKTENFESVKLNKIYKPFPNEQAEVDVTVVTQDNRIRFIECKAHLPNGFVDHNEVDKWVNKRIPTLRKYIKNHPDWRDKKVSFELWTTANFCDESLKLLMCESDKTQRYSLEFYNSKDVEKTIKSCNDKELYFTYINYFRNNPLA